MGDNYWVTNWWKYRIVVQVPQKLGARGAVQPSRASSIEIFVDEDCAQYVIWHPSVSFFKDCSRFIITENHILKKHSIAIGNQLRRYQRAQILLFWSSGKQQAKALRSKWGLAFYTSFLSFCFLCQYHNLYDLVSTGKLNCLKRIHCATSP